MIQLLDRHPCLTGWLGTTATLSAGVVSQLEQLTLVFRLVASVLAVIAGFLTVAITWRKLTASRRA